MFYEPQKNGNIPNNIPNQNVEPNVLSNMGNNIGNTASDVATNIGNTASNVATNIGNTASTVATNIGNTASNVATNIGNTASNVATNIGNVGSVVADNTQTIVNNVSSSVSKGVEDIGEAIQLKQFSASENFSEATESFLESNSIVAKFVFVILVVIVFLVLMNLGIYLLGYFLQPANNPYIVNGMIQGTNFVKVTRDPKHINSVILKHSNNQKGGMEFSWSVWLNLKNNTNTKTQYSHIFSIGNNSFDPTSGLATVENGPGLYLSNLDSSGNQVKSANLHLVMDTMADGSTFNQSTDISNLPYDKWFNVIIRMKNTVLDIYINGVITSRMNFANVPRQNYNDVLICANGGFTGALSNLRYYDYALNVFEITSIVYSGPNLNASTINGTSSAVKGGYSYLSNLWYTSK
jgi:hypothetical protein